MIDSWSFNFVFIMKIELAKSVNNYLVKKKIYKDLGWEKEI